MSVTVLQVCDLCPNVGAVYPHPVGFWRVCLSCWEKAAAELDAKRAAPPPTVCPACQGNGEPYCPFCKPPVWAVGKEEPK